MKQQGWIKLHRQLLDWEWYDDVKTCRVFIHLLLKANHNDSSWRGIFIKRGQLLTSLQKLSSEISLSVREIRTAIKHLKSTNEITIETTTQFTIITVNNYNEYQREDKPSDKRATNERQTSDKRATTNNNNKNENKDKKYKDHFEDKFWKNYPRKIGKKKARRKYESIVKSKRKEKEVLAGLKKYLNKWRKEGTETQYIPHPTTWLNQGRWEDELSDNSITESKARTRYGTHTESWEDTKKALEKQGFNIS